MSPLQRRTPPKRVSAKRQQREGTLYSTVKRSTKPIAKVNPVAEAKRRKRRKKHHAKYRASATFTVVEQRAAGRCEGSLLWMKGSKDSQVVPVLWDVRDGMEWEAHGAYVRCVETDDLEHHHRSYARARDGNERPDDMTILCQRCHGFVERVYHPTRKNGR